MREEMIKHFAGEIVWALTENVPGTETPDGSYISRALLSEDAALRLAEVIASMISVAIDERSTQ